MNYNKSLVTLGIWSTKNRIVRKNLNPLFLKTNPRTQAQNMFISKDQTKFWLQNKLKSYKHRFPHLLYLNQTHYKEILLHANCSHLIFIWVTLTLWDSETHREEIRASYLVVSLLQLSPSVWPLSMLNKYTWNEWVNESNSFQASSRNRSAGFSNTGKIHWLIFLKTSIK